MSQKINDRTLIFSNFINSIIFYNVSIKIRYACITSLNSQKNTVSKDIKFDLPSLKKNHVSLTNDVRKLKKSQMMIPTISICVPNFNELC
jgi:hypothetical protein